MSRAPDDPCVPNPQRVFLQSKPDDDDGDGNPRDENYPAINDEDDDIADHAWIDDEAGVHHLFFQSEGLGAPSAIEHYVSTDFHSLEYAGTALQVDPAGWDSFALWAPHVVRSGNRYFMFYTGLSGPPGPDTKQRIGLAVSTDLATWTRLPVNRCAGTVGQGCIYECAECWTTWGGPVGNYNQQCRDAFVEWDAAHARWVLFATAKSPNGFGVITVAYSTDLTSWVGAGYIDASRRSATGIGAQATGGQAENAFVMSRQGTHYLLFTDWWDPEDLCDVPNPHAMVQYATSSSLTADSTGSLQWTYRGPIPDPGVNAIEVQVVGRTWVMTQSISNRSVADYPVHRRQLRLRRVLWGADHTFSTADWP